MSPPRTAARARWLFQREQALSAVSNRRGQERFDRLRRVSPLLSRFDSARVLLDWLRAETDSRGQDDKDLLLRDLLRLSRTGAEEASCAWALLFLAFWSPLNRLFEESIWSAGDAAPDEVIDAFNYLVVRLNLQTVNRVAAALSRGTRRDARRARRHAHHRALLHAPVPEEDGAAGKFPEELTELASEEPLEQDADVVALRGHISSVVGEADADLVVGAALYGVNQRVMAERLGIPYEAARKRRQRAIKRLEHRFARGRRRPKCPNPRAGLRSRSKGGAP